MRGCEHTGACGRKPPFNRAFGCGKIKAVHYVQPIRTAETLRRLGRYEVLRLLATGGMAEIFLGRVRGPEGFEKIVVLKRIKPALSAESDVVDLFLHEARIAATLHHPNIVQVHETGVDEGSYFFAMEYVHGENLSTVLHEVSRRGQTVPLDVALAIMAGICAGLHHAHERRDAAGQPLQIIHRDISPSNVLLGYEGSVKLMDFGIAKAATRSSETTKGVLRGKVAYMAPEQIRADPLDRRADLFSLCVVFYEMLTLSRLFGGGASDFAVLEAVLRKDFPPPSSLRPQCPPGIDEIIMKGLQRDRDRRYQTAEELQADIEAVASKLHLTLSTLTLRRFVRELFGERVEAWQNAERHGISLADHVIAQAPTKATPAPLRSIAPVAALSATRATPPRLSRGLRWQYKLLLATAALGVCATVAVTVRRRSHSRTPPAAVVTTEPAVPTVPAALERIDAGPAPAAAASAAHAPPAPPPATPIAPLAPPVVKPPAAVKARPPRKVAPEVQRRKPAVWDPEGLLPP
jgi:serine/threonine protein kinase